MAELAIWIASFVAVGWLSILCAYAIGMILLLPVTGLAWVVEDMFPRVRLLLQPVGNVASRFRPAALAAISVLPRSRAAIVIFVFVISCGAYLALRPLLHPAVEQDSAISKGVSKCQAMSENFFSEFAPQALRHCKRPYAERVRIYNPATGAWTVPIQVTGPDGSISEFPEGMADADIEVVMRKQFPAPAGGQAPRASSSPGDPWADFVTPAPAPAGKPSAGLPE